MQSEAGRHLGVAVLLLAMLGTSAAMAGSHVVIAFTPPLPVLNPTTVAFPPPGALPGQPPALPASLPPQVTFAPPRAVPFIVQGGHR